MKSLLTKILSYLDLRTLFSGEHKRNFNLRMMHGMNRISILMFIICILMLVIRYLFS